MATRDVNSSTEPNRFRNLDPNGILIIFGSFNTETRDMSNMFDLPDMFAGHNPRATYDAHEVNKDLDWDVTETPSGVLIQYGRDAATAESNPPRSDWKVGIHPMTQREQRKCDEEAKTFADHSALIQGLEPGHQPDYYSPRSWMMSPSSTPIQHITPRLASMMSKRTPIRCDPPRSLKGPGPVMPPPCRTSQQEPQQSWRVHQSSPSQ